MIIGFRGRLGKGKTLGMTVLGQWVREITDIDVVAANFNVSYAQHRLENPNQMDELTNEQPSIVLLDEVWAWWDSRKAMSNEDMSDIVMNSRKRGCVIIYTVQYLNMADVRLRQLTDYIVIPRHYNALDIGQDTDLLIMDVFETESLEKVRTFKINPQPFYDTYDTTEEVSTSNESEEYEEHIEMVEEMFRTEEIDHKKEAVSYLTVEEGLSPTKAERLVDVAKMNVKQETDD